MTPPTLRSFYWSHMSHKFHSVVIRQLTTQTGRGLSRQQRSELAKYQQEMLGRKFCANPITYMSALLAIPHHEDMTTSFCSQLVGGAYKRMGTHGLSSPSHVSALLLSPPPLTSSPPPTFQRAAAGRGGGEQLLAARLQPEVRRQAAAARGSEARPGAQAR